MTTTRRRGGDGDHSRQTDHTAQTTGGDEAATATTLPQDRPHNPVPSTEVRTPSCKHRLWN
eukprot:2652363-Pyramimonas_sp.AAC.1